MSSGGKAQTVGYKYFLGVQLALCHGRVDAITELIIGERSAWKGNVTASTDVTVSAPELFGGDKSQGGVGGLMAIRMGDQTQTQDPYLVEQCGANVPAYLDLTTIIFKKFWWSSMNPYFKAPWLRVRRILQGWSNNVPWYPEKARIGDHDMNPAHIIVQCLTQTEWGMGYSIGDIDQTSFVAAADKLHSESFGMSLLWEKAMPIEDFIQIVLNHINGTLRLNLITGKFTLKLIRDGYNVNDLVELNPDNVLSLTSFERLGTGELVNQLSVKWVDRNEKEQIVTVHDLATVEGQGAIIGTTREYLGIRDEALAMRVAMRDLLTTSTPLAKVSLTCNRVLWDKEQGDELAFTWPKLGITKMPMRVISIDKGTLLDGRIQVELIEDVFAMPSAVYSKPQPPLWQDTSQDPAPSPVRKVIEAPYWEVQRALSPGDFSVFPPTGAMLATLAKQPNGMCFDYGVRVGPSYADGLRGSFAPTALVDTAVAPAATSIKYKAGNNLSFVELGEYALLGDEVIRIDAINPVTSTLTVGRGCLDTVTRDWPTDTAIIFAQDFLGGDGVTYSQGQTLNVKMTPRTGSGELAVGSAPTDNVTMAGRFNRPYPPGRLRFSGVEGVEPSSAYPTKVLGAFTVSWASRNRLVQNLEDESQGNITSEPGVTYTLRIYEGATLLVTASGLTGTSYTSPLKGLRNLRIELESVRDGVTSFTRHNHSFVLENVQRLISEAGDAVVSESGDRILLE